VPEAVEEQNENADKIDWRAFWIGLMFVMLQQDSPLNTSWGNGIPKETQAALWQTYRYYHTGFPWFAS